MIQYISFTQIPGQGTVVPNFSYYSVADDEVIEVIDGQEMILTQDLMVEGLLVVSGVLTTLPDYQDQGLWCTIPLNKNIIVEQDRLMLYKSPFLVSGNLRVLGDLMEI